MRETGFNRLIVAIYMALLLDAASADRAIYAAETPKTPRSFEVFAGADISASSWLVYSGATIVPLGGDIHENGFRLRAGGGYGGYRYLRSPELVPRGVGGDGSLVFESVERRFKAATGFSDVLAGYLQRFGPLTAKAFAGVSIITHDVEPAGLFALPDTENEVQGSELGVKGVVELWLDTGSWNWNSFDVGYTEAHETGSARMRNGFRLYPQFSAGAETILDMNAEHRQGRAGLFLRYEWRGGEVSASGGVSGDLPNPETLEFPTSPYGAVNWISHF